MQQPSAMLNPHQHYITWQFPERLPTDPFFMVYHPCNCGHEVRVEAVPVQDYFRSGWQAADHERMNYQANQALAEHLAQNYQYPPANHNVDNNNGENHGVRRNERRRNERRRNERNRAHRPNNMPPDNNQQRQPNLLGPVLENWLVYPEYEPDPPRRNFVERNPPEETSEGTIEDTPDTDNESDECER